METLRLLYRTALGFAGLLLGAFLGAFFFNSVWGLLVGIPAAIALAFDGWKPRSQRGIVDPGRSQV